MQHAVPCILRMLFGSLESALSSPSLAIQAIESASGDLSQASLEWSSNDTLLAC